MWGNPDFQNIFYNILGVIIVALLTTAFIALRSFLKRKITKRKFIAVMGRDALSNSAPVGVRANGQMK
jgi:hypothetical protein